MEFLELKTIEQQADELLNNLVLIQKELEQKTTAREQFKEETSSIVHSLTTLANEVQHIRAIFSQINQPDMFQLFQKIEETRQQVESVVPTLKGEVEVNVGAINETAQTFEQKVQTYLDQYSLTNHTLSTTIDTIEPTVKKSLDTNMEKTQQVLTTFEQTTNSTISQFATERQSLASTITGLQQIVSNMQQHFERIINSITQNNEGLQTIVQNVTTHETFMKEETNKIQEAIGEASKMLEQLLKGVAESSDYLKNTSQTLHASFSQQDAKMNNVYIVLENLTTSLIGHLEQLQKHFTLNMEKLDQKMINQQLVNEEKLAIITKRLDEQENRQLQMMEQLSFITNWLNTNGEILVTNSRTGIFGRKK